MLIGSEQIPLKNENGARFSFRSGEIVETKAMGRGTMQPIKSLYRSAGASFNGSSSMAESKQSRGRPSRKGSRGTSSAPGHAVLERLVSSLAQAGTQILALLARDNPRRRQWAQEHPAGFYHELLRGLLRLSYCAVAADRLSAPCRLQECSAGLRFGTAFQPDELQRFGRLIADQASSRECTSLAESFAELYQMFLSLRPHITSPNTLELGTSGLNRRWQGGSWFTPQRIVDSLLDLTLNPLMADYPAGPLRICDPACGGGAFLVRAAQRLRTRVSSPDKASRSIAESIFGVDVDAAAVELCRFALWLQAPTSLAPWRFMEESIRIGDSLIGATPAMAGAFADPDHRSRERDRCDAACASILSQQAHAAGGNAARSLPQAFHWHLEFPEVFSPTRSAVPAAETGYMGGFDLVIGNPPFLNRLEDATAADPSIAAFLRTRFGGTIRCYADAATAFLVLASQIARPGGRIALIQPQSLLAARDAAPARKLLAQTCTLGVLWFATERIFDASVRVCAPVLIRGGNRRLALRRFGNEFAEYPPLPITMDELAAQTTWSPLVAEILGVPRIDLPHTDAVVGDLATVTADFRDQYYGLRGCVRDRKDPAEGHPKMVTTGMIDLAHFAWGERPVRFDRQYWWHPRVELSRLEPSLQRWAASRLQPKILIATQTRIIEAVVDHTGELLPMTPLISVLPRTPDSLWLLAAAITSPPIAALAMSRHAGAAMSVDAIKLSASQIAALPLPSGEGTAWQEAAALFQAASATIDEQDRFELLSQSAALMCRAYGLSESQSARVFEWWRGRVAGKRRQAPRAPAAPPAPIEPAG